MGIAKIYSRDVQVAEVGESVHAVATRMKEQDVGTLVVVDTGRRPVGIVTDRDLVVRVLFEELAPRDTRIAFVMTAHPRTVAESTPVEEVLHLMRDLGVRRLPVVGAAGELVGLVSVDDVFGLLAEDIANLSRILAHSAGGAGLPVRSAAPRRTGTPNSIERAVGEGAT